MKSFFEKLGFHKMDEMERYIALRAQFNAYMFLIVALIIWTFYESYRVYTYHTPINLAPCFLLIAASLIQTLSQLILGKKATQGDLDYGDNRARWRVMIAVAVAVAVALAASLGALVILQGVV